MPGADTIKVAVRVRPFNDREKKLGSKCIVAMTGQSTELTNPNEPREEPKKFTYDYSYWSHDGSKVSEPDQYLEPDGDKYIDQKKVFDDLGKQMLTNVWKGYNCSLFAYGQTGSGKTYSIMGYKANKGIVPMICEEMFIDMKDRKESSFQVAISMIEIHNEHIRDLLNPKNTPIGGLQIRGDGNRGFYVMSLRKINVNSYADILDKIYEGTKNRTIATTNMNASSSRAHTVVTVTVVQQHEQNGQNMTKTSIINLVDLAGSERIGKSGAEGDRLEEAKSINKSLSALGNVIKALVSVGAGKNAHIPYRDSKLTMLLQNALGGNSKTIMIAAISPADDNYEETLSTLRFANRAKEIKTRAVINESPTDKLIRELKAANERLKKQLQGNEGVKDSDEQTEGIRTMLEEQIQRNRELMEMEAVWKRKLAEVESASQAKIEHEKEKQEQMKITPHLWNLNEDPSLTGVIVHFIPQGETRVGNNKANPTPEILLNGLSILQEHCIIINDRSIVQIKPCSKAKITLNGKLLTEEKKLHHNDRVLIGSNHLYVLHHPQDLAMNMETGKTDEKVTYEKAQEEITENLGFHLGSKDKSKEVLMLREDLVKTVPMVSEANAISEELNKKTIFEIALVSPHARELKHGRTQVNVIMKNPDNGTQFMWSRDKFLNRKYIMQEMYQSFMEGDKDWDVEKAKDPFWEPPDSQVDIGYSHVSLESLSYMIEMNETVVITDYTGVQKGFLAVSIIPCRENGTEFDDNDDMFCEPEELIGKPVYFKLQISGARGLPQQFNKSFCRYKFYLDDTVQKTKEVSGTINPDYKYERLLKIPCVTKQFLDYLSGQPILIEVLGRQYDRPRSVREPTGLTLSMSIRSTTARSYRELLSIDTHKKLNKIYDMIKEAKKKGESSLPIAQVEKVLKTGERETSHLTS
ncbi:kinesin-like protein KIF28 [Glandiceps talaboti]